MICENCKKTVGGLLSRHMGGFQKFGVPLCGPDKNDYYIFKCILGVPYL